MAELGFRSIEEMVGQADCLELREGIDHWKYKTLDLTPVLYKEETPPHVKLYNTTRQDHGLEDALDWQLMEKAQPTLEKMEKVFASFPIKNTNRTVGTILSNEITRKYRAEGLPEDTIHFKFDGTAGQSFAAFGTRGITMELEGDANDYFGKGLSGARLIVYPSERGAFVPEENIIIGNVAFYGATAGEAFIRGKAGERFCVRNSGVHAVVEGVGDHGCEYMTGGRVVILGSTGRNFAAGMSGGIAYVYDVKGDFAEKCNMEMVELHAVLPDESEELHDLLSKHNAYTKSSIASFVLDDFDNQLKNFVKVFPVDYRKALEKATVKADKEM